MSQEAEEAEQRITRRLRELRLERGLTLDKVAAAADLTPGYLSRVESGQRVPSLGTLVVLARALDVSIADLVAAEERPSPIVKREDAVTYGTRGASMTHLSPPSSALEATLVTLRGKSVPQRPTQHRGEEWLHVVSGHLELTLVSETHLLAVSDSAQFPGSTDHTLRGAPDAEVLVVIA